MPNFKSQYEARYKASSEAIEFQTYFSLSHKSAIKKAKKTAIKNNTLLNGVYYFNDVNFTLNKIY